MNGKNWLSIRNGLCAALAVVALALSAEAAPAHAEKDFGRLTGTVLDTEGNPVMGATILVMGPMVPGVSDAEASVVRLVTDFRGEFAAARLLPGWYSLKVTAPTRIPSLRPDIHVERGATVREKFVLGDVFASIRVQSPQTTSSSWGEDWKWILRSSAATRPVLRFQDDLAANDAKEGHEGLPSTSRLFGMSPGNSRREALNGDPGPGSILAYFRPLSEDSDVLVAGTVTADGSTASSVATAFRRNVMKNDPQELALAVHQLSFADGIPLAGGDTQESLHSARIFVATYNNSHQLTKSLALSTGMEVDYLNAGLSAMSARPHAALTYRLGHADYVDVKYGAFNPASPEDLVDRIGALTAYPQIAMGGFHPQFANLDHTEAAYTHRINKHSYLQVAAYHDAFYNTAVWGFGGVGAMDWLAGTALPNPAANGWTLNAGNYTSSGVRVAYTRRLWSLMDAAVTYSSGDALAASPADVASLAGGGLRAELRPAPSQAVGGKVSARIPRSKTQITTSYEWISRNRVTGIDPFGEAELGIEPLLDIQIRQPLPMLAFLPGRIEAMADFGNPFMQGYVTVNHAGDQMVLTPVYRSFRGGFSVQF